MDGANSWHGGGAPTIYLSAGLPQVRIETTLCHEIREMLENAFKRVNPAYVGRETHENRRMNPESDQFAAFLLMRTFETRERLQGSGFDFVRFARDQARSAASVIAHATTLFPTAYDGPAPVAGLWLYEAPWRNGRRETPHLENLRVTQVAHLNGFSTSRARFGSAVAATRFPDRYAAALDFEPVREAFEWARPAFGEIGGLDLFGDHNFTVAAEPLRVGSVVGQVLLTAVRRDCIALVDPWLSRLGMAAVTG